MRTALALAILLTFCRVAFSASDSELGSAYMESMKKLAEASDDYVRLRNLRCTTANRKSEEDVQLCIASHDMVVARYMAEKNYHSMKLRALTFPKKKREVILDKMLPNVTVREFNKESGRLQAFVESLYATPDSHPFKDE